MGLTSAQNEAASKQGNVLVVAGAGTGKTRTLVERILHSLLSSRDVSIEHLLVVTFTEAAATEIRQRIRLRLEEEQNRNPNDFRWHEQLALFETAHIGTLHSFCLQLIRPHFYELELDPQLSVLAEDEAQLLAEETLDTVFNSRYADNEGTVQDVQELIECQGKGSDQAIRSLVLRLHHYTQTLPDPTAWFREQGALFERTQPFHWHDWLQKAFAEWRTESLPFLQSQTGNQIAGKCAGVLLNLSPTPARDAIADALQQIVTVCKPPNGAQQTLKNFQGDVEFLLSVAQLDKTSDPLEEDWQWVRQPMTTLLKLTRQFTDTFTENKRQLGVLDFHDLEQYALRLLWDQTTDQPTPVAKQWRETLRFLFVDEYQDINAAQDKIIQALSREGSAANRFLVGDVKQSIYRFRQAAPHIFQGYAESWRNDKGSTVPLTDNFRSREGILDFVNALFTLVMRKESGGVAYDDNAALRFGNADERQALKATQFSSPNVELHLRVKPGGAERNREMENEEGFAELIDIEEAAREARLVALKCRELKAEKHRIWDESSKQFRAVEWNDIAILLRAPSGKGECYAKEFARLSVPLQVERSGFYDSIEVLDLVNLLQILDNPLQDVPVLAVLHSPLAGLTANELAAIRLAAKGPFWSALILWHDNQVAARRRKASRPSEGPKGAGETPALPAQQELIDVDGTLQKIIAFLDRYSRWRRLARQNSLSRCLETALDETQYDTFLLTQPRGEQRHSNVQRLLKLAQQFDHLQRQGLFRFLRFIDAQKRAQADPEVKTVALENSVRLMSIHQSKGLEFPVVIVADLNKPFNLSDLNSGVILDEHYGLCPQIKPPHTGKRYPSLPYWLARRRQRRELLGEELRLLYVAMTRARDTLLLFASVSEKRLPELARGDSRVKNLQDARSVFDWIGFWFARHYVETTAANQLEALATQPRPGIPIHHPPAPGLLHSGQSKLLSWTIHHEEELLQSGAELPDSRSRVEPAESSEIFAHFQQRLSWKYGFIDATRTPAKASVTALRKQASALLEDEVFDSRFAGSRNQKWGKPRQYLETPGASAAEIGTAHHKFIQAMSLEMDTDTSAAGLATEARRLCQSQLLMDEELALLDFKAIAAFWNSDLGQRIKTRAAELHRELQFTTRFSAKALNQITGEYPYTSLADEFIVVQGVADLVVLSPGGIWLLDFKTDEIRAEMLQERVRLYEPQMKLYARALAQIYERPVTGCWLYFLSLGKGIEVSGF